MMPIIQCKLCGSPYKVQSKFKYCQCENCPHVLIENAPYTYGVIGKNIDVPFARYTGILYEQRNPNGPYVPVRDDDKKNKKKKKYRRKPKSEMFDYSYLALEYEKQKLEKEKLINLAHTI